MKPRSDAQTQRCRERPSRINLGEQRPLSSFVSQRCVKMLMKGVIIYENSTIKMEFTSGGFCLHAAPLHQSFPRCRQLTRWLPCLATCTLRLQDPLQLLL